MRRSRSWAPLDDEFRYSLQAIVSSAFCLESFAGGFADLVPEPVASQRAWNLANQRPAGKKLPAAVRIAIALESAFDLSGCPLTTWRDDISWLFDQRNSAAHFSESFDAPVLHDTGVQTSKALVVFSMAPALRAGDTMMAVVKTASENPSADVDEWTGWTRSGVEKLSDQHQHMRRP